MSLSELLNQSARAHDSLLCVGLDPRASSAAIARDECLRLIDATAGVAAVFKPNSAFFEVFGAEGMAALRDVIAHVPAGTPVILDAKRGDIGETSEAYARAAFDSLGATALTVNAYLGQDAIAPFLARNDQGAFILCKTSNPGADEFQSLPVGTEMLYERIAMRAVEWNARDNVGLVVGATDPAALARVRAIAADLWFLVPGIGAQGGDLRKTIENGLRTDGLGLIVSASRSIARASDPKAEATRLRDEMNRYRSTRVAGVPPSEPWRKTLAADLVRSGCVRFGQFTMKSGASTPIYLDLRRLVSHPAILHRVAAAYARILEGLTFDRIAGIPYAALPIATAISLHMNRPLIYPRREAKEYGTRASIEGDYAAGDRIAVIDDLVTTGGTKIETVQKLAEAGLVVRDIIVLIDRAQGATDVLAEAGYHLHAVVTLPELLDEWLRSGAITTERHAEVLAYLQRPVAA
jgi:uridine monophosphate synthetase